MGCRVSKNIVKVNPSDNNRHSRSHEEVAKSSEDCEQDVIVRPSSEKVSLNKEMNNQVRGSEISCTNNIDHVSQDQRQTNQLNQKTKKDERFKGKIP